MIFMSASSFNYALVLVWSLGATGTVNCLFSLIMAPQVFLYFLIG
jgi:hypothetical protein